MCARETAAEIMAEIDLLPGTSVTVHCPAAVVTVPAPWPGRLVVPLQFVTTAPLSVYDAPGGKLIRQVAAGAIIDVWEQAGDWWRVTRPPLREMWVQAPRLYSAP